MQERVTGQPYKDSSHIEVSPIDQRKDASGNIGAHMILSQIYQRLRCDHYPYGEIIEEIRGI